MATGQDVKRGVSTRLSASHPRRKMTPEEINQLVAEKIMEWTPKPCNLEETKREVIYYDDGYVECPCCKVMKHIDDFEHGIIPPPRYSTDMNAVWHVLRKMAEQKGAVFLNFRHLLLKDSGDEIYPASDLLESMTDWTPVTICEVALKAIGVI